MEEWRKIPGYDSYEVSNTGKVRNNNYNRTGIQKELSYKKNRNYPAVCLFNDGKPKYVTVHRLVAALFIPNPRNCKEVNHIDGNIENNNVENLEWCTREENLEHAKANGLSGRHSRPIISTFPDGSEKEFASTAEASRVTGVSKANIWRILNGVYEGTRGYSFRYSEPTYPER